MLEERIRDLWIAVERLGRPIVNHRNPGAPVELLERAFGSPVPSDVATWFAWANGVAYAADQTQDDVALVPGYEPVSVEEAAALKAELEVPEVEFLGSYWIPLLATGAGDFYAATYVPGQETSRVVSVMIGETSRIAFLSVDQMVSVFVALYRDGVFFVDGEGILQADDVRWLEREEEAVREA
ncbi:SMI1/KNR4 family protein [Streptomyces erythrochromogenes]|uniref:hypothetical protein n=1 Tax=Streptomyces erythrochromogenes TaxID=285574 RepID=UPI0037FEFEEF